MPYFPTDKYTFVKFKRSHLKHKKYDAILKNKDTNRYVNVPFGAREFWTILRAACARSLGLSTVQS